MENTSAVSLETNEVSGASQEASPTTWMCVLCGWVYDEEQGDPSGGVPAGTRWADVPDTWVCPDCGVGKSEFIMMQV